MDVLYLHVLWLSGCLAAEPGVYIICVHKQMSSHTERIRDKFGGTGAVPGCLYSYLWTSYYGTDRLSIWFSFMFGFHRWIYILWASKMITTHNLSRWKSVELWSRTILHRMLNFCLHLHLFFKRHIWSEWSLVLILIIMHSWVYFAAWFCFHSAQLGSFVRPSQIEYGNLRYYFIYKYNTEK